MKLCTIRVNSDNDTTESFFYDMIKQTSWFWIFSVFFGSIQPHTLVSYFQLCIKEPGLPFPFANIAAKMLLALYPKDSSLLPIGYPSSETVFIVRPVSVNTHFVPMPMPAKLLKVWYKTKATATWQHPHPSLLLHPTKKIRGSFWLLTSLVWVRYVWLGLAAFFGCVHL